MPSAAQADTLLVAFSGMGDVKGILARFQASHGIVILAFYDTRHAMRALRQISGKRIEVLDDACLVPAFISLAQVEKVMIFSRLPPASSLAHLREQLTGKSPFLSELDGSFFVTVEGQPVVSMDVQKMLSSFGELASFTAAGTDSHDQVRSRNFCIDPSLLASRVYTP